MSRNLKNWQKKLTDTFDFVAVFGENSTAEKTTIDFISILLIEAQEEAVKVERGRILKKLPKKWNSDSLESWVKMILGANAFGAMSFPEPQIYADGKISGYNTCLNDIIKIIKA